MTDKPQGERPGQGEAPTQQMPRVPKDEPKAETPATQEASKPGAEAAEAADKPTKAAKPAKAAPSSASKPASQKPANPKSGAGSSQEPSVSARQPLSRPAGGGTSATGGPRKPLSGLSKDEYTRTTQEGPDTTAVIPAVKDDGPTPQSKGEGAPRTTKATAPSAKKPAPAPVKSESSTSAVQVEPDAEPAGPGRASLRLRYIEPWSVTRLAFVVSVALMIVGVVAVSVFWVVLQVTGVWSALNDSVANILSDDAGGFDITEYFGFGRLIGLTLVLSALNVVFMTALATIAAHLYNLAAQILGGIKLTFADERR
ncbi:DUF3566 domain-containing protein [Aeromicrobium phragmitis]|uniref:DUF3566 domain-containing protein n=1 Tax=Aeromicrobium phragmitis TaxID=2478914 RepID=UPI001FB607CB|nr:DUF3566 domain-containing protein [Aeromicrobium phragmitis]